MGVLVKVFALHRLHVLLWCVLVWGLHRRTRRRKDLAIVIVLLHVNRLLIRVIVTLDAQEIATMEISALDIVLANTKGVVVDVVGV